MRWRWKRPEKADFDGVAMGYGSLSQGAVSNRVGAGGRRRSVSMAYDTRQGVRHVGLGRWLGRNSIGYSGGINLYEYTDSSPVVSSQGVGPNIPGQGVGPNIPGVYGCTLKAGGFKLEDVYDDPPPGFKCPPHDMPGNLKLILADLIAQMASECDPGDVALCNGKMLEGTMKTGCKPVKQKGALKASLIFGPGTPANLPDPIHCTYECHGASMCCCVRDDELGIPPGLGLQ